MPPVTMFPPVLHTGVPRRRMIDQLDLMYPHHALALDLPEPLFKEITLDAQKCASCMPSVTMFPPVLPTGVPRRRMLDQLDLKLRKLSTLTTLLHFAG
jgi:hypothetical protein